MYSRVGTLRFTTVITTNCTATAQTIKLKRVLASGTVHVCAGISQVQIGDYLRLFASWDF